MSTALAVLIFVILPLCVVGICFIHHSSTKDHKKRTCPLCHVGTVMVEEMMDEWDDPIIVACDECGHMGGW